MRILRESTKTILTIDESSPLGSGGEAHVFSVAQDTEVVAKIYRQPTAQRIEKLVAMLANPPIESAGRQRQAPIAWPLDLLSSTTGRGVVGFLMPRIVGVRPLVEYYNPTKRRQHCPLFNYQYLHHTAHNLAVAIRSLHARGYVVGDMNESNILVSNTALVSLVDTDSFQVFDTRTGKMFRCPVGKPEFTPPELQGRRFGEMDRGPESDLFGLAGLIFQLLMEGNHPFEGAYLGAGEPPPYEARIKAGHFPHAGRSQVPYRPRGGMPPFEILHPSIRHRLMECFIEGHANPARRPTADTWVSVIKEAETALVTCTVNASHRFGGHLPKCPWCERTALLKGRDPFPSIEAVQRGVHHRPRPDAPKAHIPVRNGMRLLGIPMRQRTPGATHHLPHLVRRKPTHPIRASGTWRNVPQRRAATGLAALLQNPWACLSLAAAILSFFLDDTPALALGFGAAGCVLGALGWDRATHMMGRGAFVATLGILLSVVSILVPKPLMWASPALTRTLSEHAAAVKFVGFSRDGQTMISASQDGTVKVWDARRNALQFSMGTEPRFGQVTSAAASPDGHVVATGQWTGEVIFWDILGKKWGRVISAHKHLVLAMAFSSDGEILVTAGQDHQIRLWEVSTQRLLTSFPNAGGAAYSIAFSPDGLSTASGSGDGSITLWSMPGLVLHSSGREHAGAVNALTFSADGQMLASAGADHTAKLWSISYSALTVKAKMEHPGWVGAVAFAPLNGRLVTGASDYKVRLWNVDYWYSGSILQSNSLTAKPIEMPKSSHVTKPLDVSSPQSFDIADEMDPVVPLMDGRPHILKMAADCSVAFSHFGQELVGLGMDKTIKYWDAVTGRRRLKLGLSGSQLSSAVALASDGKTVAYGDSVGAIRMWDTTTGHLSFSVTGHNTGISKLVFSSDGAMLASADVSGRIRLWDVRGAHVRYDLLGHTGSTWSLAFSPDGQYLASGGEDAALRVWDTAKGSLRTTHTRNQPIFALAFSPDNKRLAAGGGDPKIEIWNLNSSKLELSFAGGNRSITSLAFSPSGLLLAAGARDGQVNLWEAQNGAEWAKWSGHGGAVHSVAFSPDGTLLASGSEDATVRVWPTVSGGGSR